ncbi:MAG: hypothetical protein ACK5S6_05395 [bacterium]|jgi:hypothetical protein
MQLIKQSTSTTILVGPVLDSTGAAVTTAVVGDFKIAKNGTTATLSGATVTHDANGYYTIALTTGNTDTTGRLTIYSGNTAHSMATHRYSVLLASVFDALITNATNATGGLVAATGAISSLSGALDATSISDALLSRNVSNVESTCPEHCLATIVLAMLEHAISGNTLTIKRTNGSTTHVTKTLTSDAGAAPITGVQ